MQNMNANAMVDNGQWQQQTQGYSSYFILRTTQGYIVSKG